MLKSVHIPVYLPGHEGTYPIELGEHDTIEVLAILIVKTGKVGDCKFEEIFLFEEDSDDELPRHHRVSSTNGKRLHAHHCHFVEVTLVHGDKSKTHKVRPGVTIRKLTEWAEENFPVDKKCHYRLCLGSPKSEPLPLDAHIGSYAKRSDCKVALYLTSKEIEIIVNGRKKVVAEKHLSYIQVVRLAFDPVDSETIYTVTYKKGPPANPQGSMVEGDTVKLDCGMIFNVTPTRKS